MMRFPFSLIFGLVLFTVAVLGRASPLPPTLASLTATASPASSLPPSSSLSSTTTTSLDDPEITPPPSLDAGSLELQEKWHLTTFWACVTIATDEHCGWHEPVLPGGDEIAAAPTFSRGGMAGVGFAALVVAGLLL